MPKPLPESLRETVKLLVFQGLKPERICAATGVQHSTLRTWIMRYGWDKTVAEGREILKDAGTTALVREVSKDLASASERLRNELSEELGEQVSAIRGKKVAKDIRAIGRRADVVNTITQTAVKVFGWDSQNDQRLVNVTLLSSYEPHDPEPEPQQVIEADVSK